MGEGCREQGDHCVYRRLLRVAGGPYHNRGEVLLRSRAALWRGQAHYHAAAHYPHLVAGGSPGQHDDHRQRKWHAGHGTEVYTLGPNAQRISDDGPAVYWADQRAAAWNVFLQRQVLRPYQRAL